jgi:hypothetical protein
MVLGAVTVDTNALLRSITATCDVRTAIGSVLDGVDGFRQPLRRNRQPADDGAVAFTA